MSRANNVAVLDIGSQKISVLIVERPNNGILSVKAISEIAYDGFMDGVFISGSDAARAIAEALCAVKENGYKLRKLYVGVPSEFCEVRIASPVMEFSKSRRITQADLDGLIERGNPFKNDMEVVLVNSSASYYVLDNSKKVVEPAGLEAREVRAHLSYISCRRALIEFLDKTLADSGITDTVFVNSTYAETMCLFEPQLRDKYVIFADIGYLTTSVALIRGDGILHMLSFSLGGAFIIGAITEEFEVTFKEAAALFVKVNLSFDASDNDVYNVNVDGRALSFPAQRVNSLVQRYVKALGDYINKALSLSKSDFPASLPLYLSGGGISGIRGAKEYLGKVLGRQAELAVPGIAPGYNKPYYSSSIGLAEYAFSKEDELRSGGLFNRIFK